MSSTMSVPGEAQEEGAREAAGSAFAGMIAGFALLALVDAAFLATQVPLPRGGGIPLRLLHHAFAAGETLALGALAGALTGLWLRFAALPRWASMVVPAAAVAPAIHAAIGIELDRQASVTFEGRLEGPLFALLLAGASVGLPAAHACGAFASRERGLRAVAVAIALAGMIGNQLVLPDDYFGSHVVIAWVAATLAGAALGPLASRAGTSLLRGLRGRGVAAALALAALAGLLVPPSNRVRCELFRLPSSFAWIPATLLWSAPEIQRPASPPDASWLPPDAPRPPIPPTDPPVLPAAPVVVLVTIDALRADVVDDPANDARFPTLAAMKRAGVQFTRATSPGSQTVVSLSTLFTGRAFSELRWTPHGVGSSRFLYPADDTAPRFPALLVQRRVDTVSYCSINFLATEFGVLGGFIEQYVIPAGRHHAGARSMIDPVVQRLTRPVSGGPLFLYTHLTEPHAPYDRGVAAGTDRERYVSEVAVADAELGRVWATLASSYPDRGVLIVSADHGEAFGEHGTTEHTKTLYEEVLRVPLLVRGPGIAPRRVEQRVGLVDVGPTILDLFRVPTPARWEGRSLAPLLMGRGTTLDRPLVAEGRKRRALYLDDGAGGELAVLEDLRRKTAELYDLARDPGEEENLFDVDPDRAEPALAALRAFFAARELRVDGYRTPYKP